MTETSPVTSPVEKPKKRVNSKKKGSNFEGHVGKVLGDALAPLQFRRSQSSGAILGGLNEKFLEKFSNDAKVLFVGDVVPTNEADVARDLGWKFRFTLECKFYKTPDTIDHLFQDTRIMKWFGEAMIDAVKVDKVPLLIFKFNHTETFCAVQDSTSMPSGITKAMMLTYTKPTFRSVQIFLLSEALQDLDWWKVSTVKPT